MSKQNKSDQSKSEEITDEKAVIWLLLLLCLSWIFLTPFFVCFQSLNFWNKI